MQVDSIRRQAVNGVIGVVLALAAQPVCASLNSSFVLFESGQVRPLALSPDGSRLFAVDTPDNRLEIYSVGASGLTKTGEVEVGMEPVAVSARTNTEVWVVNNLSDSVSIVDVSGTPQVVRTLLVGDEPRDIVFAGPGGTRAFITTARRGQNVPASVPPSLATPGTPRALVWVFDATNLGNTLEGVPLTIIQLFGDTPRALAVSPSGNTVYAAVFHSGNQTATVTQNSVCDDASLTDNTPAGPCTTANGTNAPGGLPNPERSADNAGRPDTGLIVHYNGSHWVDGICAGGTRVGMECRADGECPASTCTIRNWDNAIQFTLPDLDVFTIDATTSPPVELSGNQYAHVGTVLFNMVANPASGKVYVSNTDANNTERFEGSSVIGGSTVRGHLHEARITVLDGSNVLPRHLNKHIDYSIVPSPPGTADASLATPVGMAVSSDGATLYVAGFGSQKIGVYDTAKLEADTFQTQPADGVRYVPLAAGGPSGMVLDEAHQRLYVLTRFDNAISVVNTATLTEDPSLKRPLYNPEPASVVNGRHFLYDAAFTSSNGEASCSSCHVFGNFDSLAWDLGDPDNSVVPNPNPFERPFSGPVFHPMKGPMTTLSLRGLSNDGPMHWRGDRTGGTFVGDPNALNETLAFDAFNVAFNGLLGRDGPLTADEMAAFTAFALQETYPPNPIRNLDNSLTTAQSDGQTFFMGTIVDSQRCNDCHVVDPGQNHFGTAGLSSTEGETQEFKIPHLRNIYQKVGMFGFPGTGPTGPQVRGFGFLHDGSVDTVFDFLHAAVFAFDDNVQRRNVESFVFAMDSDLAPIVGQQVTLTSANDALTAVTARVGLLEQRMDAGECDVIVKGEVAGLQRGWLRQAGGDFRSDRAAEPLLTDTQLRAFAGTAGQDLTYTAVPPGSGTRMGIDRDEDGYFDRDELDAGSDPANPLSIPGGTSTALIPTKKIEIKNALPDDESKNKIVVLAKSGSITTPAPGSAGDPRCNSDPTGTVKATLRVSSATSGQSYTADLPCQNWKLIGSAARPRGYKYTDGPLADGTAKTVLWKNQNQLKATLLGKGPAVLNYDLIPGDTQDPVAVTFSASIFNLCMQCTGSNGKDGSDGKLFLGKDCPAPAACAP